MAYIYENATGSGAVSTTYTATGNQQLISVVLTLDAAPTTSENLVIVLDSVKGVAYDETLLTYDPSEDSGQDIRYTPDSDIPLTVGDKITVTYTNTDAATYGLVITVSGTVSNAGHTMFEAVLETARLVGGYRSGKATGGSSTTIVDSKRPEGDDYYNEGTALLIQDAGGDSIAEWGRVSDYVQSTGTATVDTSFITACASGSVYALVPAITPDEIVTAINIALRGIEYTAWDRTSLDVVSGQTEYTLPTDIMSGDLLEVWIPTTDDSDDNRATKIYGWRVERTAAGTGDTLILPSGMTVDQDIWLHYKVRHVPLYDPVDAIHDEIPLNLIIYKAAASILLERHGQNTGDKTLVDRFNYLQDMAKDMERQHAIYIPQKTARSLRWQ